jgi:hypothetical protein
MIRMCIATPDLSIFLFFIQFDQSDDKNIKNDRKSIFLCVQFNDTSYQAMFCLDMHIYITVRIIVLFLFENILINTVRTWPF